MDLPVDKRIKSEEKSLIELNEIQEKVLLLGVQEADGDDTEESVRELGELAATAGAQVAGRVIQRRESIHPGTYLGKGKLDEVRALLWETEATGVICDDELSPAQLNNLQQELDCKVMDRTLLILDIFAKHATSSEGKLQVELAQLRYRAARLTGLGNSLSRLGGGIGTRGPGETKLEMDPDAYQPTEAGAGGGHPAPGSDPCPEKKIRTEDCRARRLHICWEVGAV